MPLVEVGRVSSERKSRGSVFGTKQQTDVLKKAEKSTSSNDFEKGASAMKLEPARRSILNANDIRRLVVFSVVRLIMVPTCAWLAGGFQNWQDANWQPGLDLHSFTSAPMATRIHAVAILTLVATGWGMLALPKGDRRHKTLGWIWVGSMGVMGLTALSSVIDRLPLGGRRRGVVSRVRSKQVGEYAANPLATGFAMEAFMPMLRDVDAR